MKRLHVKSNKSTITKSIKAKSLIVLMLSFLFHNLSFSQNVYSECDAINLEHRAYHTYVTPAVAFELKVPRKVLFHYDLVAHDPSDDASGLVLNSAGHIVVGFYTVGDGISKYGYEEVELPAGQYALYAHTYDVSDQSTALITMVDAYIPKKAPSFLNVDKSIYCYGENVTLSTSTPEADFVNIFQRRINNGSYEQIAETISSTYNDDYTSRFSSNFTTPVIIDYRVCARYKNCTDIISDYIYSAPIYIYSPSSLSSQPVALNETCFNKNDGQIIVTGVSGGTVGKKYSLRKKKANGDIIGAGNQTILDGVLPTFKNLSSGTYDIQIANIDNNGSEFCFSTTAEIIVGSPPILTAELGAITNVACRGTSTGIIPVTANGGNGTYIYSLEKVGTGIIATNTTSNNNYTFEGLLAGTYNVFVKDIKGCEISVSGNNYIPLTITEPASLSASAVVQTPYNGQTLSCWNASDGKITVTGANGNTSGIYSYSIKKDDGTGTYINIPAYTGSVTNITGSYTFQNLLSGKYRLTVTDCSTGSINNDVTLTAPTRPQIGTLVLQQVSCYGGNNGSASITASGGKGPYMFSLDNTNWRTAVALNDVITGLSAGSYTLYMKDFYNCSAASVPFTIIQPTVLQATFVKTMPLCNGGSDGKIKVTASGGAPNTNFYQVNINGGAFVDVDVNQSYVFSDLAAGSYVVSLRDRDAPACFQSFTNIILSQPSLIAIDTIRTSKPLCQGESNGSITLKAKNGTPGTTIDYYYSLDGINFYPPNDNGNFTTPANLASGTYTVYARDGNHKAYNVQNTGAASLCVGSANIILKDANLISTTYATSPVKCYGESTGSITVTSVTGGKGPYSYSWETNNQVIAGQSGLVLSNLSKGTYKFIVTDQSSCKSAQSINITEPSAALAIDNIQLVKTTCKTTTDGRAVVTASGGTSPYNYKLDNGSYGTVTLFTNIAGGNHTITVKDALGCVTSGNFKMVGDTVLVKSLNISNASVKGGSDGYFTFQVEGGSGHQYSINNGLKQSLPQFTGLSAGKYLTTIFYNTSCVDTFSVVILDVPAIKKLDVLAKEIIPVSCNGSKDGKASVMVIGGKAPYTYLWDRAGETTDEITGLAQGNYKVKVTDALDSLAWYTAVVPGPKALALIYSQVTALTCSESCDGKITVEADGGVAPYRYQWNGGSLNGKEITSLCSGKYSLTVIDANNCQMSKDFIIEKPSYYNILERSSISACVGQKITLDAGSQWKAYEWSSSAGILATTQTITLDQPGNYFIKVKSADGCTIKDTIEMITSSTLLEAKFLIPSEVIKGDTVVFIDVSWPIPDSIKWECDKAFTELASDEYSKQIIFPEAGTYTIKLSSTLGECKSYTKKIITVFEPGTSTVIIPETLGYSGFREIKLFPNPNSGQFTVDVLLEQAQEVKFEVRNVYGDSMFSVTRESKDHHIEEVNLADLKSGIYVALVHAGKESKSIRFIVN